MAQEMKFTGYIPSPKDPHDFKLSQLVKVGAVEAIPEVFMPDYSEIPTYHQHKQPSCIGHAVTWMVNYYEWEEKKSLDPLSPRFVYSLCKRDDGRPNEDGTFYRQGLKEAQKYGSPKDYLFPNDTTLPRNTYNDTKLISQEAYDDADFKRIKSYVQVDDKSFNGLKRAIYDQKVVLIAIDVGPNMYTDRFGNITWAENQILPLRIPDVIESGHAVVGIGYDKDYIYFKNSWGFDWGSSKQAPGVGYFGQNYEKYIKEAWTSVDLPDELVAQLKEANLTLIDLLKKYIEYLKEQLSKTGRAIGSFFSRG